MPTAHSKVKSHPLLNKFLKLRVAAALRKEHNLSFADSRELAESLTDDVIDDTIHQTDGAVGAIGDGKILAAILAFLQSEQGRALIKMLIALLMGL